MTILKGCNLSKLSKQKIHKSQTKKKADLPLKLNSFHIMDNKLAVIWTLDYSLVQHDTCCQQTINLFTKGSNKIIAPFNGPNQQI